jgi:hypothetical protein
MLVVYLVFGFLLAVIANIRLYQVRSATWTLFQVQSRRLQKLENALEALEASQGHKAYGGQTDMKAFDSSNGHAPPSPSDSLRPESFDILASSGPPADPVLVNGPKALPEVFRGTVVLNELSVEANVVPLTSTEPVDHAEESRETIPEASEATEATQAAAAKSKKSGRRKSSRPKATVDRVDNTIQVQ